MNDDQLGRLGMMLIVFLVFIGLAGWKIDDKLTQILRAIEKNTPALDRPSTPYEQKGAKQ